MYFLEESSITTMLGLVAFFILLFVAISSVDGKLRMVYLQYKLRNRCITLRFKHEQTDTVAADLKNDLITLLTHYVSAGKMKGLTINLSESPDPLRKDEVLVILDCKQNEDKIKVDLQLKTGNGFIRKDGDNHWTRIFHRAGLRGVHQAIFANQTAMLILEAIRLDQKRSFQID